MVAVLCLEKGIDAVKEFLKKHHFFQKKLTNWQVIWWQVMHDETPPTFHGTRYLLPLR